jgi:hypothetical protein
MRAILTVLVLSSLVARADAAGPPPRQTLDSFAHVQRLIRQLGSEDYETRQRAYQDLLRLEPPDSLLREGLSSSDREIVRKIRSLISTLTQRRIDRASKRLREDARAVRADLFAERFLLWQGPDDAAPCWQAFLDLIWNIIDHEKRTTRRSPFRREAIFPAEEPCPLSKSRTGRAARPVSRPAKADRREAGRQTQVHRPRRAGRNRGDSATASSSRPTRFTSLM